MTDNSRIDDHRSVLGSRRIRRIDSIELSRLLDELTQTLNSDFGLATQAAANLAALLASKLSDASRSIIARGGLAPWQKSKVQRYIESGLEGTLPIGVLAELVSLSPSYFSRAFKESFGVSPHTFIIRARVERAKVLMSSTSDSLSQIAVACGLADQAHLCRCFRRVIGLTPGVWRRSHVARSQFADSTAEVGECRLVAIGGHRSPPVLADPRCSPYPGH